MNIVFNAEKKWTPSHCVILPTQGNFYHNVLTCFGFSGDYPPVADLLRSYHGLEGEWLIVSPICWEATHNDAIIVASGDALNLTDEESRRWFAAFEGFMALDNVRTYYHDADTWLLRCDGTPKITAKPIFKLLNQSLMPELQRLDETHYWSRFITENQMFFSQHVLNKTREGLYPLNGVWLWGSGVLGPPVKVPVVCENDHLARFAKLLATDVVIDPTLSSIPKTGVLMCEDLEHQLLEKLEAQLKKHTVRWYWNNMAYQSSRAHWWSRLLEKIL